MKFFEAPEMQVVFFEIRDIITTSEATEPVEPTKSVLGTDIL